MQAAPTHPGCAVDAPDPFLEGLERRGLLQLAELGADAPEQRGRLLSHGTHGTGCLLVPVNTRPVSVMSI